MTILQLFGILFIGCFMAVEKIIEHRQNQPERVSEPSRLHRYIARGMYP